MAETATESVTSLPNEDAGDVDRVGAANVMAMGDTDDVESNDEDEAVGDIWYVPNRNERVAEDSNAKELPEKAESKLSTIKRTKKWRCIQF